MTASLPEAWIVDAIIALVAVEGLVLVVWRARTGGGLPIAGGLANLASGAALLLALRAALTAASPGTVLAFLSLALVAHVADVARRWEAASSRNPSRPERVSSLLALPSESQHV